MVRITTRWRQRWSNLFAARPAFCLLKTGDISCHKGSSSMPRRGMLFGFLWIAFYSHSIISGATFEAKPTTNPVSTMVVAEDGELFATAHEKYNQVSIWDVKTAKVINTLECESPRALLWRGNKLFVANGGKG